MEKAIVNSIFDQNNNIELELKNALEDVERLRKNNLELKLKVIELIKLIRNVRETLNNTQNNINEI